MIFKTGGRQVFRVVGAFSAFSTKLCAPRMDSRVPGHLSLMLASILLSPAAAGSNLPTKRNRTRLRLVQCATTPRIVAETWARVSTSQKKLDVCTVPPLNNNDVIVIQSKYPQEVSARFGFHTVAFKINFTVGSWLFQVTGADHAVRSFCQLLRPSAEVSLGNSRGTAMFTANPQVRITCGETLPNGTIIDLVAAADRDALDVLSYNDKLEVSIAPAIDAGAGIFYQPPDLHASVRAAVTFPQGAVQYSAVAELFVKICALFCKLVGLPEDLAAFATCWTLSTWIPELMLIPLALVVSGGLKHQNCNVLRLFGSLCRRALLVAELSRHLPFFLNPTLLINDPRLSPKACILAGCELPRALRCRAWGRA